MKKNLLLLALFSAAILVSASVFAHTGDTTESNTYDWMDEMHDSITSQLNDKELVEAMDEMHEECETFMGGGIRRGMM